MPKLTKANPFGSTIDRSEMTQREPNFWFWRRAVGTAGPQQGAGFGNGPLFFTPSGAGDITTTESHHNIDTPIAMTIERVTIDVSTNTLDAAGTDLELMVNGVAQASAKIDIDQQTGILTVAVNLAVAAGDRLSYRLGGAGGAVIPGTAGQVDVRGIVTQWRATSAS